VEPSLEELTAVAEKLGLTVEESDSAEDVTTAISTAEITEDSLENFTKAELQTLCDVLEITYDANATKAQLKALILAD